MCTCTWTHFPWSWHKDLFVVSLLGLSRNVILIHWLHRSWCRPANTTRPDRIGFPNNCWSPARVAEEDTHSPVVIHSLPWLGYFFGLKASEMWMCQRAAELVIDWVKAACTGEAVGGGHRSEPCSLSFRSAKSRISSLTEMLLSLCQIRPGCSTHVTAHSMQ